MLAAVDAGLLQVPDVVRSSVSVDTAGDRARHTHGGAFDPTLRWVTDPRSHGRRLAAYAEALGRRPAGTWPGFPFTPAPEEWRR